MDKKIILAVAGSGKTSLIIDNLNLEKRFLLITYTKSNTKNLRDGIIEKFGYFPDNIQLYSYFPFLYGFCFKPFLSYKLKVKGIFWDFPPEYTLKKKRSDLSFYLTEGRRLYHNRIAKLLQELNVLDDINERLEKYYDCLYIDEIQDFAGHDFDLLKSLVRAKLEIKLVGDFYQHTFDTSRDGTTNNDLHNDYKEYIKNFEQLGIKPDTEHLNKSWRCTPTICNFITENLKIEIYSHKNNMSTVEFISDPKIIEEIFSNNNVVKLFYRESSKYKCLSRNWGDSKGENKFEDVCVVLNKTTMKHFKDKKLSKLVSGTKNKLYVACSRPHRNLFFIEEESIKHHKKPSSET
ncbi:MAG: AAA family ATPase [Burkholderiales bacterium]|nr:AAA family ATPase [Burkholderiales bacterium]